MSRGAHCGLSMQWLLCGKARKNLGQQLGTTIYLA